MAALAEHSVSPAALLHDSLAQTLVELTDHSQQEVLEIGNRIGHMVELAEGYAVTIDALNQNLQLDSLAALSSEQQERLGAILDRIQAGIQEQLRVISGLLDTATNITTTLTTLRRGIQSARLLSVYVRIEGATLNTGRVEVNSLAGKLAALCERMERASDGVSTLLGVLLESLPTLEQRLQNGLKSCDEQRHAVMLHATAITKGAGLLSGELEERFTTCRANVQQTINASHQALSSLQFQDPMIQSLQRLDPLAAEARCASGEPDATPVEFAAGFDSAAAFRSSGTEPAESASDVDAGELILF